MRHRRAIPAALCTAGALVLAAQAASAHVHVDPGEAPKGGFAQLTFRVPNERDDAPTTEVEVNLPTDTPIASVSVQPKPGWTYETATAPLDEPVETDDGELTEAVTKVTWSGGRIAPGEFDTFSISVGPLPEDADQIVFPTLQTYEGGDVVRWIDPPNADGSEPESPAPVLALVDGGDDHDAAAGGGDEVASGEDEGAAGEGVTVENAATQDDVDGASTLAVVGIVVGLLGLAVAVVALVRRRGGRAAADPGGSDHPAS